MIEVLYYSDREVRRKLLARVAESKGLLLVAGVRHGPHMTKPEEREPFAAIDDVFGAYVNQLLIADDGTLEGMWRDPMGDLGDALFPDDRTAAFEASTSYVLLKDGVVEAVVKKSAGEDDLFPLQEALAAAHPRIPRPDKRRRPNPAKTTTTTEKPKPPPSKKVEVPKDAWQMLGLERGASLEEARRAFRALVVQYHPDKVAHLAIEFRELAERRTREIMTAWEELQRALSK